MNSIFEYYLAVLIILLSACSPRVVLKNQNTAITYPKVAPYESFALIENENENENENEKDKEIEGTFIAQMDIKDGGLTIECDYETIKRLAVKNAREMGGNCIVIREHKLPDFSSSCHRIKCEVYRIDDPEEYERLIVWHPVRLLKIGDFKGPPSNDIYQAMTMSSIQCFATANKLNGKGQIEVESIFDCQGSFFRPSKEDSLVLRHEQLHFDITEIYARKFVKYIKENVHSSQQLQAEHEKIYSGIIGQLKKQQEQYDREVFAASTRQAKWEEWVKNELNAMVTYNDKKVVLPIRRKKKKD